MVHRSPSPLRRVLMAWLTLTFVLAWLPLVRSLMDGTSYRWGTRYFGVSFSGAGLAGDLWLLVALTAFGLWLLFRGWRDPSPPFPAALLAWLGLLSANSLFNLLTEPGGYRFQGATLGVDVSLAAVAPLLHVGFFCLALVWAARGETSGERGARPAWTATNTALAGLVVLFFPAQFVLLRSGQGQEAKDVVGVLLTISQWLLVSAALFPWRSRGSSRTVAGERVPA